MKNQSFFTDYLTQAQNLNIALDRGDRTMQDLYELIDKQQQHFGDDLRYQPFFKGEKALFRGQYEQALKFYLQAKEIPDFPFFCYRASAYVSHKIGQNDKAISFAKKALGIYPEDYLTLKILQKLVAHSPNRQQSDAVHEKIQSVVNDTSGAPKVNLSCIEDVSAPLPFGEKELDELSHIFQGQQEENDHLFIDEEEEKNLEFLFSKQNIFDKKPLSVPHVKPLPSFFLSHILNKPFDGIFLRWCQKGIVINPSEGFLEKFQAYGFSILDIDIAIVTRDDPSAYADLRVMYDLNCQSNKDTQTVHIIHYFLHHQVQQEVGRFLKPHYKQERGTVHSMDLFIDSEDVEEIIIESGIILKYLADQGAQTSDMAITLELSSHERTSVFSMSKEGVRFDWKSS